MKAGNRASGFMLQLPSLLCKGIASLASTVVALFSITSPQAPPPAVGRMALLCLLMNINCLDHLNAATRTPPDRMAFQSYLTDIDGTPMGASAPVNKRIKFIIYESENGADSKWAEQQVVSVNNGHFSVILGEGTRLNDSSGKQLSFAVVFAGTGASDRFIELTVISDSGGSDQTLLPRLRLLPSPYAFMASKVASLDLTDTDVLEGKLGRGNIEDGAINSVKIEDGTIASADIANSTITSADIANSTITSSDIQDGTITSSDIEDETIASDDIADSTITSSDIEDGTIASADIANSTITSADIANSTITSSDIQDGTITSSDIQDGTVTASDLGNNTLYSTSTTKLRIIRGYVKNGDKSQGDGFTSKRIGHGKYQVDFTTVFTTSPVVVVSGHSASAPDDNTCNTDNVTKSSFRVVIYDQDGGAEDEDFMFIAIGN
jgi:hypothetical protein